MEEGEIGYRIMSNLLSFSGIFGVLIFRQKDQDPPVFYTRILLTKIQKFLFVVVEKDEFENLDKKYWKHPSLFRKVTNKKYWKIIRTKNSVLASRQEHFKKTRKILLSFLKETSVLQGFKNLNF